MQVENTPGITVLLATRDRSSVLATTLESFCRLEPVEASVEFLIVDNGNSDETRSVLESFRSRLPLRVLFEDRAGKCYAMNRGLEDEFLKEIVVFTDDDVSPRPDWLRAILAAVGRWPDADVFGGRILPHWPPGVPLPAWIGDEWVRGVGYAEHDLGQSERLYPDGTTPLGPNFWVRLRALAGGIRFDERIGARPHDRTMGEEVDFVSRLCDSAPGLVYVPSAEVAHRIAASTISRRWLARRAVHYGKGLARIHPLCHPDLLERHPVAWYSRRCLAILRQSARLVVSGLRPSSRERVSRSAQAITWLIYNQESLRRAWRDRKHTRN